eukprot:2907468-Rhodomonas_salina.1
MSMCTSSRGRDAQRVDLGPRGRPSRVDFVTMQSPHFAWLFSKVRDGTSSLHCVTRTTSAPFLWMNRLCRMS